MSSKAYRCRSGSRRVPPSGQKPSLKLTPRTVEAMAEEVVAYHRLFERYFQRREQCQWSLIYLCGQLSNIERKTIEPMVLDLKGPDQNAVRALQQFIGAGAWDAQTILQRHQELVAQSLGDADGVVIVDGSGFPKQGHHSAGVARQYCGHLGKVANCQEGVFLVYATHRGYTFLDGRLYLPERWFEAEARPRWPRCGIPEDLTFHTEPELALDMLEGLVQRAVIPFRWVTADEHFGQNPAFLDGVAALGKFYLAEVPCDTRVWLRTPAVERPGCGPLGRPRTKPRVALNAPRPRQVRDLAKRVPPQAWNRYLVKEGSKGPLVAKFAFLRVTTVREGLPGPRVWLVFRRRLGPHPEWKFYFSNAPTTVAQRELAQLSGWRWPVETALEEGKGEVGMDHYETRSWCGWYHHMSQTFMAHHALIRLRIKFKKNSGADHGPSAAVSRPCAQAGRGGLRGHPDACRVLSAAEPRGLQFASETHASISAPLYYSKA